MKFDFNCSDRDCDNFWVGGFDESTCPRCGRAGVECGNASVMEQVSSGRDDPLYRNRMSAVVGGMSKKEFDIHAQKGEIKRSNADPLALRRAALEREDRRAEQIAEMDMQQPNYDTMQMDPRESFFPFSY